MNSRDNENMKELFERFMDTEQAQSNVEDIRKAEQFLLEHPAPKPDTMLLANIKAQMQKRLSARKTYVFSKTTYRIACAAASIIIIFAIILGKFNKNTTPGKTHFASIMPTALWESDDITTDDTNLASYTIEIEKIEQELRSLEAGESTGNGNSSINELEMELVAINNDFWKE